MASGRVDMKIVLLGKEYGGKTSLVERYLHDRFTGDMPYQSTIGAAFGAKRIEIEDRSITLGIWDTAGSERYEAMSRIYYRGARAAIVCYDLSDRTSFERVRFWVKELRNNEDKCKIYLCGTKKDITDEEKNKRAIDYHMTTDYADEINSIVFETSSKSGENIRELFHQIGLDYVNDPSNQLPRVSGNQKKNVNIFKKKQNKSDEDAFEVQDSGKKFSCCG